MPTEDVAHQQRLKIRRTTLGFGVIQVLLGLALTGLSFTAFVLSESEKIRNACPYWAGFTVLCCGGVGVIAWRYTTMLSMGLFTFFSAVCVVLHMIGTILTGEIGGLLKSIIICQHSIINNSCMCCDSIMTCKQNVPTFEFEGVENCSIITGLMKELMYGLCVLNIFGSLVCFIATILGCTSVARQAGRDQPLFRRRLSARSDSHEQSQYSWLHYPTDLNVLPPYAPPIYRSVDNVQDCGATPYIVPPPVFDPTDLPPPYSSRNASLSSSGFSLNLPDSTPRRSRHNDRDDSAEGGAAIVLSEGGTIVHHHYDNHYQQRVYSENRARPGNPVQITNVVLTRNGILERCGTENRTQRSAIQAITSLNSSHASMQSEARISVDRIEQQIVQGCEKAEECKEDNESQERIYKSKQSSRMRCLGTVEQPSELITFEDSRKKRNNKAKRQSTASKYLDQKLKSPKVTEDEFSSTSDSGIGEELALLYEPTDSLIESNAESSKESNEPTANYSNNEIGSGQDDMVDTTANHETNFETSNLVFSSRDAVSLDNPTVKTESFKVDNISDDVKLKSDDLRLSMDLKESMGSSSQTSDPCTNTETKLDGHLDGERDLITREYPTDLLVDSLQGNASFSASEVQRDSIRQTLDSDHENSRPKMRSPWDATAGNVRNEETGDSTEEVIRLMDDFVTTKSTINRTRNEVLGCGSTRSHDTRKDVKQLNRHVMVEEEISTGDLLASNPVASTTGKTHSLNSQSAHSLKGFTRVYHDDGSISTQRESVERNKSRLAARSDTCMTVPHLTSRDMGTVSDPSVSGVGTFKYPGCHRSFHHGITIVPPNIELPMEIREESFSHSVTATESKRRKRHGGSDVPRPKRRALRNKDEFTRMKAKYQHKATARKDETTRLRERHVMAQNVRVREEISRSYWQVYNGKCLVPKSKDEWLRNPAVWTSLKRSKSVQRFRGLRPHTKQVPTDVNSERMPCPGKETLV